MKKIRKDRTNELRKFAEKYNRLPNSNIKEEQDLYNWMNRHKDAREVKKLIKKYRNNYTQKIIDFIKEHHRLPNSRIKEEKNLYNWMNKHKDDPGIKELIEKYGINYLQKLIDFIKEYHRLPKSKIKEEHGLYSWMNRHKDNPGVKELIEKYGEEKIDSSQIIIDFIKEHHRLPRFIKGEYNLYESMRKRIRKKEKYPELYLYYTLFTHQDESGVKDMINNMINRETLSDWGFLFSVHNQPKALYMIKTCIT